MKRILIYDCESANFSDVLADTLRSLGHHAAIASNSRDVEKQLEKEEYDAVIIGGGVNIKGEDPIVEKIKYQFSRVKRVGYICGCSNCEKHPPVKGTYDAILIKSVHSRPSLEKLFAEL